VDRLGLVAYIIYIVFMVFLLRQKPHLVQKFLSIQKLENRFNKPLQNYVVQ
jgi:hypothetical protein